jgi:HK97 family phage major capsid protein
MSVPNALTGEVKQLRARRDELKALLEQSLESAEQRGQKTLDPRQRAALDEFKQLDRRVEHAENELRRAGDPQFGQRGRAVTTTTTAGQLAPLRFPDAELRRAQAAAQAGTTARIESRDFSTADPLLPAQLYPYPIAAEHEGRLLDHLPGIAISAPSITFIRHISTTGAPAATVEGALKPEVIFNTDALTATAVKLAANNGLSWEIINDWPAFQSYAGTELYRQLIDLENLELLQGDAGDEFDGTGSVPFGPQGMQGFATTPGILTYDTSVDTGGSGATLLSALDGIEIAIAQMRVGPALATPDLLVLHPQTWSAIRRIKDSFGHFMVQPDPTAGQANEIWGIPVLQTTQQPPGFGLLIDTQRFGYVAVREPLSMRIGYSGTDFTQNILRTVAEERLVLCVTRPPAVLLINGLPTQ